MKDRFIERDGLLFMKCEPEPLDIDKHDRCLIQFIQDNTLMGRYNKEILERHILESQRIYIPRTKYIDHYHHLRFEVIATHCPEGSSAWALYQMLNGKMVLRDRAYKICHNNIYSLPEGSETWGKDHVRIDRWVDSLPKDGWKIYEEPESKFKVGDWVRNKHYNTYHQICEVRKETIVHRQAGLPKHNDAYEEHYTDVFEGDTEPASLKPDFSNAEVGNMVFSLANGYTKVEDVDEPCDPYPIEVNEQWHMSDGRISEYTLYPIVFNDHHQAKAYFDELFMQLDEEEKKDV